MRTFESLTEKEVLALAISLEEDDARIYADFADGQKRLFLQQIVQLGLASLMDGGGALVFLAANF